VLFKDAVNVSDYTVSVSLLWAGIE